MSTVSVTPSKRKIIDLKDDTFKTYGETKPMIRAQTKAEALGETLRKQLLRSKLC